MAELRSSTAASRGQREMLLKALDDTRQRRRWPSYLGIAVVFVVGLNIGLLVCDTSQAHHAHRNKVPLCAEDEFITGHGDFAHGEWESYRCSHPDDYVPTYIESEYRNPAVHSAVGGSVCEHKRFWNRAEGISIMPESCNGN